MNMFTKGKRLMGFVLLAATLSGPLLAQQQEAYKPGGTIRISFTFTGQDADHLRRAEVELRTAPQPPKDQQGFRTTLYGGDSKPIGNNNCCEVSLNIPESAATGDYAITLIRAYTEGNLLSVEYHSPDDFPNMPPFRIKNDKRFVKPTIKDVKELSKP